MNEMKSSYIPYKIYLKSFLENSQKLIQHPTLTIVALFYAGTKGVKHMLCIFKLVNGLLFWRIIIPHRTSTREQKTSQKPCEEELVNWLARFFSLL